MLKRTAALIVGGATVLGGAPAIAQSSDDSSVADIIVTARRTEERLQDVPISITVFSAEDVSKRNIVEPQDLVLYTPSLAAPGVFGRDNTTYAIRGFTQANRTTASVAVYFADVVAPRSGPTTPAGDGAGPGQFFDLQNVQVLKGPQGTLFGRNTTGGAVLLVPQKPTDRFEGYVEGLYGNYDWKGLQGAINLPLGETARLRLSGDFQDRNGLTENVSGGPDFDDRHYVSLRASLVVDLTPELENYTILQYLRSNNNGSSVRTIACDPANPIGQLFCGSPDRTFERQNAAGSVHVGDGSVANPFNKVTRYGIINTTTWSASDQLTVKNIASYSELKGSQAVSIFGSPGTFPAQLRFQVPVGTPGRGPDGFLTIPTGPFAGAPFSFTDVYSANGLRTNDQYTFSEELQFQGALLDDRLTWQAGVYFERSGPLGKTGSLSTNFISCTDVRALQCSDILAAFTRTPFSVGQRRGTVSYRNIGVYGQGSYQLADALKLTLGARYTWDRTTGVSDARFFTFPLGGPRGESCISVRASLANDCRLEYVQNSKAPTWLIGLDYNPAQDMLLYAKYARGYRQGAISLDAAEGFNTFKPEKVDAYEVGLKTTLRGAVSGVFNLAAFYNKLTDQQISAQFRSNIVSPADGIVNGGRSRIYGVEADTTLRFFDSLTLSAGYAYLNTKLVSADIPDATFPYISSDVTSIVGGDLVFSPHHKLTASLTYDLPLPESVGQVQLGAIYTYTSSQVTSAKTTPPVAVGRIPSFQLVNFNLDWRNAGGTPIDVSLFMTNALNEKYLTYRLGPALQQQIGIDAARYGDPRSYGVKLRYRFGS